MRLSACPCLMGGDVRCTRARDGAEGGGWQAGGGGGLGGVGGLQTVLYFNIAAF